MFKLICIVFIATILSITSAADNEDELTMEDFLSYECNESMDIEELKEKDKVCSRCANLHKTQSVIERCRLNCFTSEYFKNCEDNLQTKEEEPEEETL
nr:alpha-latrotoxin associated low molecular weight protein [Steatoda grossa]